MAKLAGVVKFFNGQYGFVKPDEGGKDVFIHVDILKATSWPTLKEGDRVEGWVEEARHHDRLKFVEVTSVKEGHRRKRKKDYGSASRRSNGTSHSGTGAVKFFSFEKGFGFITLDGGAGDVHLGRSVVEKAGLEFALVGGDRVQIDYRAVRGKSCPSAVSVELL